MKNTAMQKFGFHPILNEWFIHRFGQPTDVQIQAWTRIMEGSHTLISSPTGSGKTLAALFPCLDRIAKVKAGSNQPVPGVKVLYVTPLKALNNDIHQHVFRFLAEIQQLGSKRQLLTDDKQGSNLETGTSEAGGFLPSADVWTGITVGIRTGDTS